MMAPRTVIKQIQTGIFFAIVSAYLLDTVESTGGTVRSPYFPEEYPHNLDHIWGIRVSPDFRIELVFDSFNLEACSNCNCDYVAIYDGEMVSSSPVSVFCGTDTPPITLSSTNVIHIRMKTDGSVTRSGFSASYTTKLNIKAILPQETERNLTQYFLSTIRQQVFGINKWGKDITRSAVALFLHDPELFAASSYTGEEIAYDLSLQLMSKLVMKKRISTYDLALFINAMTVSCINPRKFFGVNIVGELLKRIHSSNHTNPFFILAICNAGKIIETEYIHKLQQLFGTPLRPSWTGTQAMVVMALKCISRQANINLHTTLEKMVTELKSKQKENGIVEDLKSTALVIQALIATDNYTTYFNMSMAIKSMLKKMEHTDLSTEISYYILPIFKWKTLLDVNSNHCANFVQTDLEELKALIHEETDERIQVQISVIIGDDMDFTRTWRIKVPSNFSLYQVMENVSSSDPDYKVRYTIIDGKPLITAVAHFEDSIEDGFFWFIYRKPLSSVGDLIPLEDSPVDILITETDELILWYNSGQPLSSQYGEPNATDAEIIMDTTDTEITMDTTYSDNTYDTYTTWDPTT